jgi:hypothetical protein
MFEACFAYLWLWVLFLGFAGLPSLPIVLLGRRRAQWRPWELAVFVLPYWGWVVCNFIDDSGKSLSNFVELAWLALAIPPAVLIRVGVGHPKWRWCVSASLIAVLTLAGVALWAFVPGLPE